MVQYNGWGYKVRVWGPLFLVFVTVFILSPVEEDRDLSGVVNIGVISTTDEDLSQV